MNMAKYIVLFYLFVSGSTVGYTQLTMVVKDLSICNVVIPEDADSDVFEVGPIFRVTCVIENRTDTIVTLYLKQFKSYIDDALLYYHFTFQNREYKDSGRCNPYWNGFSGILGNDTLDLLPPSVILNSGDSVTLYDHACILSKSSLLIKDYGVMDYTDRILEILPTLKIYYVDSHLTLEASKILNVRLIDSCRESQ